MVCELYVVRVKVNKLMRQRRLQQGEHKLSCTLGVVHAIHLFHIAVVVHSIGLFCA